MNKSALNKAHRIFDNLDSEPQLWRVYGETVRRLIDSAWDSVTDARQARDKLRGSGNEKQTTTRNLQMVWKRRLWRERPHVCVRCSRPVSWATHRVHHKIPVCEGGAFDDVNLEVYCVACHCEEHSTDAHYEGAGEAGL